ncbi:holin family protein [Ammoniphilus sp. YIM 78166]|uniref:phage holin family protein n=1 Tax=Ammoniphilus sp. YIM 78166 TaxID=1644106 RepID=UPI001F0E5DF2|nr:phage holin family protein [Ammoniphilus sp. YIM 78166]
MTKVDGLTIVTGTVTGFISWMIGGFGLPFTLLCGFMVADYITGLMVGWKTKDLSSRTGFTGILKKLYIVILLAAIKGLDMAVLHTNGVIYDGAAAAFIVNEFISITENGGKLGVWIPAPVKKVIRVLKEKDEKEEGGKSA